MPMGRSVIWMCALFAWADTGAQHAVTVYRSPAEMHAKRGEQVGDLLDVIPHLGRPVLLVEQEGSRRRIPCRDLWGFSYKGILFRIEPQGHLPVRLMAHGALCYYENGLAHLRMQRDGTELETFDLGHRSYISRHLEGELVPAIFPEGDARGAAARFRQAHRQFEPLFQCIGAVDDLDNTRQCVVDFEAALEGP
ncbi:MAG: hypothetical protein KIT10_09825 [Flavobacteriales bacterium]|nr:hypothetical protein [Flavobacteriales bacterium]